MRRMIPTAIALTAGLPGCALPAPVDPPMPMQVLRFNGIADGAYTLPLYMPEGEKLPFESAESSGHLRGQPARRAIDGDRSTAWASADAHAPEASLTVTFPTRYAFRGMKIKTGPTADATTFKVVASDDGKQWIPISGRLANLTWDLTPQEIGGGGKQLKVMFFNSQHDAHVRFNVYELEVYGRPSTP